MNETLNRATERTRANAEETSKRLRELAVESAYLTVGVTDTAVRYVRHLGEVAGTVRAQAPSLRNPKRFVTDLSETVERVRTAADDERETLARRGREVVESIERSRPFQRANDRTRTARSQSKAATTSAHRAASAQADAVEAAADRLGKRSPIDYRSMTVEELRELARERQIEGRSEMRKDELIAALKRA